MYIRQNSLIVNLRSLLNDSLILREESPFVEVKEAIKWMLGQRMDAKFQQDVSARTFISFLSLFLSITYPLDLSSIDHLFAFFVLREKSPFVIRLDFFHEENSVELQKVLTVTNTQPPKKKRARRIKWRKSFRAEAKACVVEEQKEEGEKDEDNDPLEQVSMPLISRLMSTLDSVPKLISADLLPVRWSSFNCTMKISYEHAYIYFAGLFLHL